MIIIICRMRNTIRNLKFLFAHCIIFQLRVLYLYGYITSRNARLHCCDRQSHFSSLMGRQYLISMASSEREEHLKLF